MDRPLPAGSHGAASAFHRRPRRLHCVRDAHRHLQRPHPFLLIATEPMDNIVLHKEIREKGGAYGGGVTYTPSTGNFHFYAYRDPHLKTSVDAFHEAIERIASRRFTDGELEEAKLGVLQNLDAPSPGNRAMVAYSWQRPKNLQPERRIPPKDTRSQRRGGRRGRWTAAERKKGLLVSF